MWAAAFMILVGIWLFFQAVVGDLAGRILSRVPS